MPVFDFIVLALATWRLASLFSTEKGPYFIFQRIRKWAGEFTTLEGVRSATTMFGQGLICLWCCSVWFGGICTLTYLFDNRFIYVFYPLALSALAIAYEKVVDLS